jgi:hypothetical protein
MSIVPAWNDTLPYCSIVVSTSYKFHTIGIDPLHLKVVVLTQFRIGWDVIILTFFETKCDYLIGQNTFTSKGVLYTSHLSIRLFVFLEFRCCVRFVTSWNMIIGFCSSSISNLVCTMNILEMINHCISYIFFNKRTFSKSVVLLSIKTITVRCRYGFLVYTLIRSIPYPFSK